MYGVRYIHPPKERTEFDKPDDRREFLQKHLSAISPKLGERVDEVLEGRVKDFFTDPKIVNQIGNGLGLNPTNIFDGSYFGLVHLTDYFPEEGMIKPAGEFEISPRYTVHFCLNGAVTSHEMGDWEDKKIAVISPVTGLDKKAETFQPQDTIYVGRIQLPKGAIVLARDDIEVPSNVGLPVEKYRFENGEDLRQVIAERMFDMGYLPVQIDALRWKSEPYKTVTSDGTKVCHQLGTYLGAGYYPDEAFRLEGIAQVLGARGSQMHDAMHWTKLLEMKVYETFKGVVDYKSQTPKVKMSSQEFDEKFPAGIFGTFEHSLESNYLVQQLENYRTRIRSLVSSK
ncbi:MAG: hypothetical protein KJ597_01420 [Nanoarchaeota archaeon]|nr:hypothetical protein [Nanoarchaeota archaeon]MBU1622212.1 hypothetical protein [Nanoarchaeota archaeon]